MPRPLLISPALRLPTRDRAPNICQPRYPVARLACSDSWPTDWLVGRVLDNSTLARQRPPRYCRGCGQLGLQTSSQSWSVAVSWRHWFAAIPATTALARLLLL